MADGGERHALLYSAFISYSHADAAFARRLHRKLEGYRLPRRLNQPIPGRAGTTRRLRPIFRDREDLSAAIDLTDAVQEAVAESETMIVICSPNAVKSTWVGCEIELFHRLHAGGTILAALIGGEVADAFPAELRVAGPGGRMLQPLAADFRKGGDGERLALLKLVAVLAGVRLDELVQRDAQRRIRQVTLAGFAALAGMAAMGVLALVAVQARSAAEQERARGETLIGFMLTDLRDKLKGVGRLDLLDAVDQGAVRYFVDQDLSKQSDKALEQRAALLQALGEDDEARNKFADARPKFEEALRTTAALLAKEPDNEHFIYAHAQSEYWIGDVDWQTGNMAAAKSAILNYVELANQLLKHSPKNAAWMVQVAEANSDLAMLVMRHDRNFDRAAALFEMSKKILETASRLNPASGEINDLVATVTGWLADADRLRGDYEKALSARSEEKLILLRLQASDPRNFEINEDITQNYIATARIYIARDQPVLAIKILHDARRQIEELRRAEPEKVELRRRAKIASLFEMEATLLLPSDQQDKAEVQKSLDHCQDELEYSENHEEFVFCSVLELRFKVSEGDNAAANAVLKSLVRESIVNSFELSPKWGFDFPAEIAKATLTMKRGQP